MFLSEFKIIWHNWSLLKFQIFFGVLEIPDIFWSERWMLGKSPYEEKMRVPSPWGLRLLYREKMEIGARMPCRKERHEGYFRDSWVKRLLSLLSLTHTTLREF